jgi:hypothetical protein
VARGSRAVHARPNRNRDNFLSRAEFLGQDDADFEDRFGDLDHQHDGR